MVASGLLNCYIKSGENNCSHEHLHQMVVLTVLHFLPPFTKEMAECIKHTHSNVHCEPDT